MTVRGHGIGGRNQEMAMAWVIAMASRPSSPPSCFASVATDGPTTSAENKLLDSMRNGGSINRRQSAMLCHGILSTMDFSIRRFETLSEADSAEAEYYASLTPEERLNILLELIEMYRSNQGEDSERLERVYRVDELSRS